MKTQSSNLRTAERNQQTRPAFVYHFNYEGTHYYFTNFDQDVIISGGPAGKMANPQTFLSSQIEHSRPERTFDVSPASVGLVLPATDTELRKWFLTTPVKTIDVEIWRLNSALLPGPVAYADLFMEFRGVVDAIGFDDYNITANAVSLMLQEDRPIPRFNNQYSCNHQLYGTFCGVIQAVFETTVSIAAVNRVDKTVQINITSVNVGNPIRNIVITEDFFEGGLAIDNQGNKIGIVSSALVPATGVKLHLQWWPYQLAPGQNITVYPGCNRTKKHCHERFENVFRFGGFPFIPASNPAIDGINT